MDQNCVESDMLTKYAADLKENIIRDASKCSGFRNDPEVREEFWQAVNRILQSWSGPNTDSVLSTLSSEINLAEVAEQDAILNWF